MQQRRKLRWTFFVAITALVLPSCDDNSPVVEPLETLEVEDPWAPLLASEPTLRWDGIGVATGPDGAECATQEMPSAECCQAFPGLPNCSWGNCGDERDTIIREYTFYGSSWAPHCVNFATSGGTTNFSWSELNDGFSGGNPHNPYSIITSGLTTGLEATRSNYNRGGILLSSGYRCPHGNFAVGSPSPNSHHTRGRAADMYSADHGGVNWTETEFNLLKAAADATSPGPIESFSWTRYDDHHYHAAW